MFYTSAHFLNLIGECGVNSCKHTVDFFSLIQNVYTFFGISTHRWVKLTNHFTKSNNVSLKNSDTRWSAKHEVCVSLNKDWIEIILTLTDFSKDSNEKFSTRCKGKGLLFKLNSLKTAFMATLWSKIMERFHSTSKNFNQLILIWERLLLYTNHLFSTCLV